MNIEELRQAIGQGEPIVINADGTPSTSEPSGQDQESTLVKPQGWARRV